MLSEYPQLRVAELVGRAYRPFDSLPDLLGNVLTEAIHETCAEEAVIRAPGICEIRSNRTQAKRLLLPEMNAELTHHAPAIPSVTGQGASNQNGCTACSLVVLNCADAIWRDHSLCHGRCVPIIYQNQSMGCVAFKFEDEAAPGPGRSAFLHSFAREVAFLVKRHVAAVYARRQLNSEAVLIGSSPALRRMEEAIEKVAPSEMAVLIEAEFGSPELATAVAVHCCSARNQGPFVAAHCAHQQPATFRAELAGVFEKAKGGTLFLQSIDELEYAMQRELLGFLGPLDPSQTLYQAEDVRVLASTSRPLNDLVREGRFSRFLRTKLGILKLEIPPLRSCRKDIRPLLEHELRKYQRQSLKSFSPEAVAVCENYAWPENLLELQRVVARLAIMTEGVYIDTADLRQHLGWQHVETRRNQPATKTHAEDVPENADEIGGCLESPMPPGDELNGTSSLIEKRTVELALGLLEGNYNNLDKYGAGMKRALTYVAEHFNQDISLTQLAKQSFFSPSHLSFLFKKTLGISFKGVLAVIRIERAKQLLLEKPCDSVTEISLDVGFGDLSHFEKTFKRSTGLNPREFRRRKLAEKNTA